jgi:hypothetical protein
MSGLGKMAIGLLALAAAGSASAAELIANGGFEAVTTASAPGSYGSYAYPNGVSGGWSFAGSGLVDGVAGTPWFGGNPPQGFEGAQYGFVQSTGTLSQSFVADATGTLQLSWLEGSRPFMYGGCCNGDQSYEVYLGSTLLGSWSTASGQNFLGRSVSGPSVVSGQSYTLAFRGLSTSDNTVFLDKVSASVSGAVPEPATWGMMILGFGLVGMSMRRRGAARTSVLQ